jgi:hypothetical protein
MQVMRDHPDELGMLIDKDLLSDDLAVARRAFATIHTLQLQQYTDRVVAIYLKGGPMGDEAKAALVWMRDSRAAGPLLKDVEKDPSTLKRHYWLLNAMLSGTDAQAVLLNELDSPDADQRFYAATALGECKAESLAGRVPALLENKDPRVVRAGVHIAFRLSDASFNGVRPRLQELLASDDLELKLDTASGFAARRDPVCANALLELLNRPSVPPNTDWRVMQALSSLADSTFNYDIHHWGPANPQNQRAIKQFQVWLIRSAQAGTSPPTDP